MPKHLLRALVLCLPLSAGVPPQAQAALDLPPIERITQYSPKLPLQVLTADGVEIAQFGPERRIYTPLARTPKLLQDALLAVEDTRFREHKGIDPKGMARALFSWVTGVGRAGGASTITQQLVRTMLLTHQFSVERKAKEIMLALKVEEALGKDRILEIYMNEIFLGQRAYGFAAASQAYFGKPMERLSLAEVAMLAGLPQNPYYANPVANLERATQRQRLVLQRMVDTGLITEAQRAAARAEKLVIRPPSQSEVQAGHVAEMARLAVVQRFGAEAYSAGMRVTTSLRAADQRAAHAALRRGVLAHERKQAWRGPEDVETLPAGDGPELERAAAQALRAHRDDELLRVAIVLAASPRELRVQLASGERVVLSGEGLRLGIAALGPKAKAPLAITRGAVLRVVQQANKSWSLAQWPQAQAALVSLDPVTGRVLALVGSYDFARTPFNHATQAQRQPGSAFKPLLYSAALEQGITPATVVDDAPFTAANGWAPQNSDGRYEGPLSLREALAKSRNLVSVRVLQQLGVGPVREWAGRLGLVAEAQPDNLTLALGAGSATPMQLAQAYAAFANGGYKVAPVLVERIADAQGKVLFEAPPAAPLNEAARVISERNAFLMQGMLNEVTRSGTAARAQAQLQRTDLYGKTGTTNDAVDAWFAGFQTNLVAVVWMGHSDSARSLGERESGGGLALPIWLDYMAAALKGVPVAGTAVPPQGLTRMGEEWWFDEWAQQGWVTRIPADGPVQRAAPAPQPASAASAASAPVPQ